MHHRDRAGGDDVCEHLTGTHRGQLFDVAHDQQRGLVGHRCQQRPHQHNVHHGRLVDHQETAGEGGVPIAPEAAVPWVDLEQAVNGLRLQAGGLAHALRGAPGRRAQQKLHALGRQDAQDGVDDRRLAHARAAGDDSDLGGERQTHCLGLAGGQCEPRLPPDPRQRLLRVDVGPGQPARGDAGQPRRDRLFCPVETAEKDAGGVFHRVRDHGAFGQLQIERGADQVVGHFQKPGRQRSQFRPPAARSAPRP